MSERNLAKRPRWQRLTEDPRRTSAEIMDGLSDRGEAERYAASLPFDELREEARCGYPQPLAEALAKELIGR